MRKDRMTDAERKVLRSYVEKYDMSQLLDELSHAVRSVEAKKRLNESIKKSIENKSDDLKELQDKIVHMHMMGKKPSEISEMLGIKEAYVRTFLKDLIKGKEV